MPRPLLLLLTTLFGVLFSVALLGQKSFEQDSSRFFSLGFSAGTPHQVAYAVDNPSNLFLTNSAILGFETYRFALHSHFIKTDGLGYGLDFGYQNFLMNVRDEPTQARFSGK